jgi:H+/Cl- antiporter ClcA
VVAAGAVLAVTQRAPITAVVLAVELTHGGLALVVPLVLCAGGALATAEATVVAGRRHRDGRA